jgi:hypothetical protein
VVEESISNHEESSRGVRGESSTHEGEAMKLLLSALLLLCCNFASAGISIFTDGFDGPWVEPPGRMKFAVVVYPNVSSTQSISRDVRQLAEVAGHGQVAGPTIPWPYQNGAAPKMRNVPRGGYLASAGICGNDAKAVSFGLSTYGNVPQHPVEYAIGPNAGQFAYPAKNLGVFGPGSPVYKIVIAPKTNGYACKPGETFYLNRRWTTTPPATAPQYLDIAENYGWSNNP